MNQNIETWKSNKGQVEIHHFLADKRNTYLFGINKQVLGEEVYYRMLELVNKQLFLRRFEEHLRKTSLGKVGRESR